MRYRVPTRWLLVVALEVPLIQWHGRKEETRKRGKRRTGDLRKQKQRFPRSSNLMIPELDNFRKAPWLTDRLRFSV